MSTKPVEPANPEEMTFEEALHELEEIVARLENETLSLDESLALFERGQSLGNRCAQILDKAELKVTHLTPGHQVGDL